MQRVARIGKTFAVKAWCDAHPGQARYVQVPSSNDDMSFFRALCDGLGLGAGVTFKAFELRAKIESVLQTGNLLLVLDEGHYLGMAATLCGIGGDDENGCRAARRWGKRFNWRRRRRKERRGERCGAGRRGER